MPTFLGLTVTTVIGTLLPAVGQVLVAAGPPKVVATDRAEPVDSNFETTTDCVDHATALALAATYRSYIGFLGVEQGGLVFVANCEPEVRPRKGTTVCDLYCKWLLNAARSWVPDAD